MGGGGFLEDSTRSRARSEDWYFDGRWWFPFARGGGEGILRRLVGYWICDGLLNSVAREMELELCERRLTYSRVFVFNSFWELRCEFLGILEVRR